MTRSEKLALRNFLDNYSDARLASLLAFAQDGCLQYNSCCCFVGCLTSPTEHSFHMEYRIEGNDHLLAARMVPGAIEAEYAFKHIGVTPFYTRNTFLGLPYGPKIRHFADSDETRRRLVIPIIRAEIKRRDILKARAVEADKISVDNLTANAVI